MTDKVVLNVKRTIGFPDAIIWLAATNANEVKFDTIPDTSIFQDPKDNQGADGRIFKFESKILKSADLLYEINFVVPVSNLTIRIPTVGSIDPTNIWFFVMQNRNNVKNVVFDPPLPIYQLYGNMILNYTYSTNIDDHKGRVSAKFDDTTVYYQYKFLNPCISVSVLQFEDRDHYRKFGRITATTDNIEEDQSHFEIDNGLATRYVF